MARIASRKSQVASLLHIFPLHSGSFFLFFGDIHCFESHSFRFGNLLIRTAQHQIGATHSNGNWFVFQEREAWKIDKCDYWLYKVLHNWKIHDILVAIFTRHRMKYTHNVTTMSSMKNVKMCQRLQNSIYRWNTSVKRCKSVNICSYVWKRWVKWWNSENQSNNLHNMIFVIRSME